MLPNKICIKILFKLLCNIIGFQYHCALKYWLVICVYIYMHISIYVLDMCVYTHIHVYSKRCCCYCSVTQLCLTLCDPMDCNTPGFPVHHQLLEPNQTHVYRVSDAIQLSHLLSSPSPPTFSLSQHQGLFQ